MDEHAPLWVFDEHFQRRYIRPAEMCMMLRVWVATCRDESEASAEDCLAFLKKQGVTLTEEVE